MEQKPQAYWTAERLLRWLLRYVGGVSLLALVAVVMPEAWMDAIHRQLGLGPLPKEPVVGYLARSTSLFYAVQGGLLIVLSFGIRQHLAVLKYVAISSIAFGLTLLVVDYAEGMPAFWTAWEGPMVVGLGLAIAGLTWRLSRKP